MKETGMINAPIEGLLSCLGHGDEMMVVDAGFAIPQGVLTIDLSLSNDVPSVPQVLSELLKHFSVEKVVFAKETKNVSPTQYDKIVGLFDPDVKTELIDHADLKERSKKVKGIIRTGDFNAFSNVLLVSGAGNRWYVEIQQK